MANDLTEKLAQDMATDIVSFDELVNGDEAKQVTTRKGATYPSVKKAIKTLFENGGLPATPFTTKALMEASALVDGDYAQVTNDTADNGLYLKTAGAWVKSAYDPTGLANTYTDNKVKGVTNNFKTKALMTASTLPDDSYAMVTEDTEATNGRYLKVAGAWVKSSYDPVKIADNNTDAKIGTLILKDSKADLHVFSDSEYNIVAKIDANSELHLTGIDGSVQDSLRDVKGVTDSLSRTGGFRSYLHVFTDNDSQVVGGIREDGGLMVTGSTVSLQEEVGIRPVEPLRVIDPQTMFSDACTPYFMNMSVSGVKNAPVPYGLLPQKYTVPDTIINAFELTPPDPYNYIPIDTPYGKNDKVVHPYVIEFRGGFRGYRYLMCINPYTYDYHENPTIFGSNSLDGEWELLTGTRQPLEEPKAGRYFSDSGFSYDPINGMLICYWRDGSTTAAGSDQYVKYRATRDGIQWTETKVLFSITEGTGHLSPSMLFNPNDGLWHFWSGVSPSHVAHYTAKNLDDSWVLAGNGTVFGMWHSEVKFAGDKYLMLANKRDPNSNYSLAISDDGTTWTQGKALFSTPPNALYKASYIANIIDDTLSLDIVYTTNHASVSELIRRFYHVKTNTIYIGE